MNQALRMKNNLVYAKHEGFEMVGLENGHIWGFQFSNRDMFTNFIGNVSILKIQIHYVISFIKNLLQMAQNHIGNFGLHLN
jgi:hypothetical protein